MAQPEEASVFEVSLRGGATHYSERVLRMVEFEDSWFTLPVSYPRYDAGWLTAGNYGLHFGYWFTTQIGVGLGWFAESRGGTIDEQFEIKDVDIKGESTARYHIDTWNFPFVLMYRLFRTEMFSLEITSGVEYGIAQDGKAVSDSYYYPPEDLNDHSEWKPENLEDNIALTGDLTAKFWPSRPIGFLLGVGYSHGLTELMYSADYRSTRNLRVYSGITLSPALFSKVNRR